MRRFDLELRPGTRLGAVVFVCACGGSTQQTAHEPVAPLPLPTFEQPPPPPPPLPPPPRAERADITLTVSFVEARKHPASARLDGVLRGTPAWHAFPSIDPVRDLDWMIQHGDDMVVHYAVSDEAVEKAIERVASAFDPHVDGVRGWRGRVTYGETVFLRKEPHVVIIVPIEHAANAARVVSTYGSVTPTFHANETALLRIVSPARVIAGIPEDIPEARIWIDSRAADGGADIYGEGDCPSATAAQTDAAAMAALVRQKNTFPVRLVTSGLFNNVELTPSGNQVHMHINATATQIDSVLALAASNYGSTP